MNLTTGVRPSSDWRGLAFITALAVIFALVLGVPSASAHEGCPEEDFCVYEHDARDGCLVGWSGNDANYWGNSYWGCNGGPHDDAESARNHGLSGRGVNIYRDWFYGGVKECIPMGQTSELNVIGDNTSSSHQWTWDC